MSSRLSVLARIYGRKSMPLARAELLRRVPSSLDPAEIARMLRAGLPLTETQRAIAAAALERGAKPRRGRPSRFSPYKDEYVYGGVVEYRKQHPGAALDREQTFGDVARLLTSPWCVLTPSAVERAYLREKKRRR